MIRYRDFLPDRVKGGFLRGDRYASFDEAVSRAAEWVRAEGIDVVNFETVVLPNIFRSGEEGTTDAHLETLEVATASNAWHQFVRVWFHDPSGSPTE
jgi:hypothetical protein